MLNNVHTLDRGLRIFLGMALLSLLAVGPVPGWGLAGLLGFVLLGTAAAGYCPIYHALGLSTADTADAPAEAQ